MREHPPTNRAKWLRYVAQRAMGDSYKAIPYRELVLNERTKKEYKSLIPNPGHKIDDGSDAFIVETFKEAFGEKLGACQRLFFQMFKKDYKRRRRSGELARQAQRKGLQ